MRQPSQALDAKKITMCFDCGFQYLLFVDDYFFPVHAAVIGLALKEKMSPVNRFPIALVISPKNLGKMAVDDHNSPLRLRIKANRLIF